MRPLSIRAGLTAWFVGLALLLLLAFAGSLYWIGARALRGGLDGRLAATAEGLARLCDWDEELGRAEFESAEEMSARFAARGGAGGQQVWTWPALETLYAAGVALDRPTLEADWGKAFAAADPARLRFDDEDGPGGRLRACTMIAWVEAPLPEFGEAPKESFAVLVRVAEDAAPLAAAIARLSWWVGGSLVAAGFTAALFGVHLSRRLVRPLRELGAAASAVRAGRRQPLPRRGTGDEVDALADHLDHAFERLEAAHERQARFTADAAHELRNPVSVIQNCAEVALRRDRTPEEYRAFLGDVLVTANRMGGAIEALLLLARLDAEGARQAFRAVDLAEVARDSAAALALGPGRLRVAIRGAPPPVHGDAGLLRVLVDNLLANAARYAPAEQPIELIIEHEDGARLTVRDGGPGIAAEHLARVFDRFYRAEATAALGSGAGLGLAIVAEVARLHGATPRIESSSAGTVVSVDFPPAAAA